MPASLLSLLPVLAILPYTYHRRKPGVVISGTFNIAQSVVALQVAHAGLDRVDVTALVSPLDLAVLLAAAVVFNVVQASLVGIVISLSTQVPVRRTGTRVFANENSSGAANSSTTAFNLRGLSLARRKRSG